MRRNVSRSGLARKNRTLRYATKSWVDRLCDTPCFILGNAPSIKDFDIHILDDYFTIGLNRIFKYQKFDPTVLFWQDSSLWKSEFNNIHNLQAMKVARDVADPKRLYYNFHLKGGGYRFEVPKQAHILFGRGSTGPVATQFAVALGCNPIVLVGMDCKTDEEGHGDFYGDNPFWLVHTLPNCRQGLKFIKEYCPVEIVSTGNTDLWPRIPLDKVLEGIDRKHAMGRQNYVETLLAFNET